MRDGLRKFTPYEGDAPYLYFAFAESDAIKVRKYLQLLCERGCRVWYGAGKADGPQEVLRRQARYKGAALTMVYLSDEACRDPNIKSNVLVNQKFGSPILCLDPDDKDRNLAMGLEETIPHLPLYKFKDREALEEAILHAEGFSQELLGEPVKISKDSVLPRLSLVICALALIMSVLFFAGVKESTAKAPQAQAADEVEIRDPVILSCVRKAAGSGPITQELAQNLTKLELEELPQSWEDLALLPALEEIRIPQEALLKDAPLPEGEYTIILTGGGS